MNVGNVAINWNIVDARENEGRCNYWQRDKLNWIWPSESKTCNSKAIKYMDGMGHITQLVNVCHIMGDLKLSVSANVLANRWKESMSSRTLFLPNSKINYWQKFLDFIIAYICNLIDIL